MSIPLDRLYEHFSCVGGTDTVIYRWLPHGSKKPRDLVSVAPLEGRFTFDDLKHKIPVVCHDQEPLDFDYYNHSLLLSEYEFTSGEVPHVDAYEDFFRKHHLRICLHPSLYAPIITHSEVGGQDIDKYRRNGFVPCYVWSHALIARDWFRYAEHDPMLQNINHDFSRNFLVYNRSWSGSREYRLRFTEMMIDYGLLPHCKITFSALDDNKYYGDHEFKNPAFGIKRFDLHDQLATNHACSAHSAVFDADDYNDTMMEVVLETLFDSDKIYLTEKILRPLACGRAFMVLAAPNSLRFLHRYGFQTFQPLIDESYDEMSNSADRLEAVVKEMQRIASMTLVQKQCLVRDMQHICDHNRKHFFSKQFQTSVLSEFVANIRNAVRVAKTKDEVSYIDRLAMYHKSNHQGYPPMAQFLDQWRQKFLNMT